MSEEQRKPWYGDGIQPYDTIVRLRWGPEFAAGNVLKYIRRTKDPEHSLESAEWYMNRLIERSVYSSRWNFVLRTLMDELTPEEQKKLKLC